MTPDPQPDRGERRWPDEIRLVQHMDFGVVPNYAATPTTCPEPGEPHKTYVRADQALARVVLAVQQRDKAIAERDALVAAIEKHREGEFFFCNKCGFMGGRDKAGPDGSHPGCSYSAGSSTRDVDLYRALTSIQEGRDG